jgi:hypothetical protein
VYLNKDQIVTLIDNADRLTIVTRA